MQFTRYHDIRRRGKVVSGQFKDTFETECVATEKVDGSNFSVNVQFDPHLVRYGRRLGFLNPGERLTKKGGRTWEELMAEMAPAFEVSTREFRERHPEATGVVFYGELFGQGVLDRVDYGPDLGFYGFDIYTGDRFLDFDEMCAIYDSAGIRRAAVLGRGTLREMLAIDPCFETLVGAERGAGEDRRQAEGTVVVPVVYTTHQNNKGRIRVIYKNKAPQFEDSVKPDPTPGNDERITRAIDVLSALLTPNRIMDVRSKHLIDISRRELCMEVFNDIFAEASGGVDPVVLRSRKVLKHMIKRVFDCYDTMVKLGLLPTEERASE
jgi:Rnl2 family RNA ligase